MSFAIIAADPERAKVPVSIPSRTTQFGAHVRIALAGGPALKFVDEFSRRSAFQYVMKSRRPLKHGEASFPRCALSTEAV